MSELIVIRCTKCDADHYLTLEEAKEFNKQKKFVCEECIQQKELPKKEKEILPKISPKRKPIDDYGFYPPYNPQPHTNPFQPYPNTTPYWGDPYLDTTTGRRRRKVNDTWYTRSSRLSTQSNKYTNPPSNSLGSFFH